MWRGVGVKNLIILVLLLKKTNYLCCDSCCSLSKIKTLKNTYFFKRTSSCSEQKKRRRRRSWNYLQNRTTHISHEIRFPRAISLGPHSNKAATIDQSLDWNLGELAILLSTWIAFWPRPTEELLQFHIAYGFDSLERKELINWSRLFPAID